uniref:Uncharacterized protein n=1 Tax=Arundo donax TaxID=35708 RepID=A0A0A8Y145_ARUDO
MKLYTGHSSQRLIAQQAFD